MTQMKQMPYEIPHSCESAPKAEGIYQASQTAAPYTATLIQRAVSPMNALSFQLTNLLSKNATSSKELHHHSQSSRQVLK